MLSYMSIAHLTVRFVQTMWVLLAVLMSSLCGVWLQLMTTMRWVDHINKDDMDIFFDRAVIILIADPDPNHYLKTHKDLALGVLIDNETVLTSFNPFRKYIKIKEKRYDVIISVLYERQISNWENVTYILRNFSVNCARQVIPMPDDEVDWAMDVKKENSPMHDLMVIRLDKALTLIPQDPSLYSFDQYGQSGVVKRTAGPMLTPLANLTHTLGRDIKFASLGFINRKHISKSCVMRSHTFDPEDNVVTDCDGWIPREWGLFICIRNIENFKGLGSGALLIHNNRLFGIGSFMLKRGDSSILVFTDVREYHHLIVNTCTMYDQTLGQDIEITFPNHTTTTTTTTTPTTTTTETTTTTPTTTTTETTTTTPTTTTTETTTTTPTTTTTETTTTTPTTTTTETTTTTPTTTTTETTTITTTTKSPQIKLVQYIDNQCTYRRDSEKLYSCECIWSRGSDYNWYVVGKPTCLKCQNFTIGVNDLFCLCCIVHDRYIKIPDDWKHNNYVNDTGMYRFSLETQEYLRFCTWNPDYDMQGVPTCYECIGNYEYNPRYCRGWG